MIKYLRYLWQFFTLSAILALLGILLIPGRDFGLPLSHYLITLCSLGLINLSAFLFMARAIGKENRDGAVIMMAGIGGKFLLYLLYLLLFWILVKNLTIQFIITFFALYLIFTFLLALHLLKMLKNN